MREAFFLCKNKPTCMLYRWRPTEYLDSTAPDGTEWKGHQGRRADCQHNKTYSRAANLFLALAQQQKLDRLHPAQIHFRLFCAISW